MRLKAFVAVILVVSALSARSSSQTIGAGAFVAGEILVRFRPGAAAGARAAAHTQAGGTPQTMIDRTRVQRVRVPAGGELAAIARYLRNPNVVSAEPNFLRTIPLPTAETSGVPVVPGDYYFAEQWGFHNTGQEFYCLDWVFGDLCFYAGVPDADIDAPEAWAVSTGASDVTVAVIDSGIDYNHPDLAANYAGGEDFITFDGDPMDDHGHGTHVAGTIAAALNNLTGTPALPEGVVGVAPHARIRAYKVCGPDGTCDDFAIQQAIARAIADGAQVINMSLGQAEYSASLDAAVQDAWNAGLVIVAGAGNDGTTAPFYPAAFPNVISVAAFDEDHARASFSNWGSWVDLSAPGSVIMSTYPLASCASSTVPGDTGCYTWLSGTSMATPHVSGAAALVWSRGDVTRNTQVVDILLGSADPQGVGSEPLNTWTVHGGLNLLNALTYQTTAPTADAGDDQAVTDDNRDGTEMVSLDGSGSADSNGTIVSYVWREGSAQIATGATASVWLSVGTHTLTLEVTDNDGETATDTVVVTVYASDPVSVTASTPQAAEAGPANGVFTVSRPEPGGSPLTVHYTLTGTADAGSDYEPLSGSVTIDADASSATIVVTPVDDEFSEADESLVLTLVADEAYTLGSPISATVTIVSDDLPPDLIVTSMAAPSTGAADADIMVTDTTKNQGTGPAQPSETGFYLSTNTTLDAADVWLDSRLVPQLAPAATHALSTTLHIPLSTAAGSYYVLAKADWESTVQESAETNNVKASAVIKIGPDLIVSALTVPANAGAGTTIDASETTKNQGAGGADASTTSFYLSANSLFDASDVIIGSRSVPALTAGASHGATTPLTVPAGTAAGTYYVIARADAASAMLETSEVNNNKIVMLRIGPDLVVTAVSAPSGAGAGATISVTQTTKNQGAGSAAASATGFYLSANAGLGSTDTFIGSGPVGELGPGATATSSTPLQIPADTPSGSYYVIAVADWNNAVAETMESNNYRASGVIKIGGDLVVTAMSAPATGKANTPIPVTDTTRNQGSAPVSESATGFYLSTGATFDASDVFLGSRAVGSLGPSESSTAVTELLIPPGTAGTFYVLAVADWDNAVSESSETNNVKSSLAIKIGPDMVVTALTAPSSVVAGTTIAASDTTKNQGGDTAAPSVTYFYLSKNSLLDATDVLVGIRAVPSLAAGASDTGSAELSIPAATPAGSHYIIAKADGDNTMVETTENNNTRARLISIAAAP
jgi:subtilisin family serine protease/subtilase family serine protease